ncbi:MAG: hypothetical protein ACLT4H_13695 [Bacteroides thetaiotaomicron]
MKTINLIFIFMTFSLNIMSQSEKRVYQEKGETETYEISSDDVNRFIYKPDMPFDKLVSTDVTVRKYKVWPIKTVVNDKEYVKKYLKSKIKENITPENSRIAISYYYELSSGKLKWITIFHKSSITIPIKAIERFENIMKKEDKATFNHDTSNIKDMPYFQRYIPYNLLEL